MNYDIKILGTKEDNGTIELDRLSFLAKSTKDIATKSLMLKYRGFSQINPDKNLKKALEIKLENITGDENEGTKLTFDCNNFSETIKTLQLNAFANKEDLLKMSPMALVIDSFRQALDENKSNVDLDKPLLKSLLTFKRNFINEDEIFYLSNRGSIPEVKITKDDFLKISKLEDSIPEPRKVIVSGKLDEMKVSKGKLGLQTLEGIVNIFANNDFIIENIVEFMGKEITISGMAHFKPNGQLSFIDIQEYKKSSENDKYFSKKPFAIDTKQQLLFQVEKKKTLNPLKNIIGQWPGDENDEEFNEILKSLK